MQVMTASIQPSSAHHLQVSTQRQSTAIRHSEPVQDVFFAATTAQPSNALSQALVTTIVTPQALDGIRAFIDSLDPQGGQPLTLSTMVQNLFKLAEHFDKKSVQLGEPVPGAYEDFARKLRLIGSEIIEQSVLEHAQAGYDIRPFVDGIPKPIRDSLETVIWFYTMDETPEPSAVFKQYMLLLRNNYNLDDTGPVIFGGLCHWDPGGITYHMKQEKDLPQPLLIQLETLEREAQQSTTPPVERLTNAMAEVNTWPNTFYVGSNAYDFLDALRVKSDYKVQANWCNLILGAFAMTLTQRPNLFVSDNERNLLQTQTLTDICERTANSLQSDPQLNEAVQRVHRANRGWRSGINTVWQTLSLTAAKERAISESNYKKYEAQVALAEQLKETLERHGVALPQA